MTKHLWTTLLLCLWLMNAPVSPACTIFSINRGGKVLVGNNEDFWYSTDAKIWFLPSEKQLYGRALFGWDNFAQGGINSQGLFFDVAAGPTTQALKLNQQSKIKQNIGDEILARCATVEAAIAQVQTYRLPPNSNGHFLFADQSGASAVVEWIGSEFRVVRKTGDYQIITNFLLTRPELGGFPCPRYSLVQERLEGKREISGGDVAYILASVAQFGEEKGRQGGTLYSNVHDLASGEFVLFYQRNFQKPVRFKLAEELQKGKHTLSMKTLFSH